MERVKQTPRGFALYEVLIGLTIFVVGILTLGRAVENCLNASTLSAEDDRVRQLLANRMAEVQATPAMPDAQREFKLESGYGQVKLTQKSISAGLKDEKDLEVNGIQRVTLTAEWKRGGATQAKKIEFYVYRAG